MSKHDAINRAHERVSSWRRAARIGELILLELLKDGPMSTRDVDAFHAELSLQYRKTLWRLLNSGLLVLTDDGSLKRTDAQRGQPR